MARYFSRLREEFKHNLVYYIALTRLVYLKASEMLEAKRLIATPNNIFLLNVEEFIAVLNGDKIINEPEFESISEGILRYKNADLPDVFLDDMPVFSPVTDTILLSEIEGIPASTGMISGVARIINEPKEIDKLNYGEILICPTIDFTWYPFFFKASGIVVELGGLLSHGAIIVRELGIPLIVNARGALRIIQDGQNVTMDGTTGKIKIHS